MDVRARAIVLIDMRREIVMVMMVNCHLMDRRHMELIVSSRNA
jgi:hypothetical protein